MIPEDATLTEDQFSLVGIRLAAIAVLSAVLTATVVIGLGRTLIEPRLHASPMDTAAVTRASTR